MRANLVTVRQRRLDDPDSFELYVGVDLWLSNLSKHDVKEKRRAAMRRAERADRGKPATGPAAGPRYRRA